MTSSTNPTSDCTSDWYEPFPEPNTMPSAWDLSDYGYTDRNRDALEYDRTVNQASA